jgi:hypothetical protein
MSNKVVLNVPTLNFLSRYRKCPLVHIFAVGLLTLFIISCVPQKTHSQQAMTKVKYVLVPDVK